MTDSETAALITAAASFVIALLSGAISLWNASKTSANSLQIENLKGVIDRNLERLKAKLSHGQVISSTQWNAEFSSYLAIWKGMTAVRTVSPKILLREGELAALGLPANYMASAMAVENWQLLVSRFSDAMETLLLAVHETAPFYPETIRKAANDTHLASKELLEKQLSALAHAAQGKDIRDEQFFEDCKCIVLKIVKGVDLVESLIRERLASVQVVNSVNL